MQYTDSDEVDEQADTADNEHLTSGKILVMLRADSKLYPKF